MRQQTLTGERSKTLPLDGQTLAAFGAACVDDGTATTGFHAHEETVGAGAAGLGGLVSTFHEGAPWGFSPGFSPPPKCIVRNLWAGTVLE